MKRLICALAALAALVWICPRAQSALLGTLRKDQGWQLVVDNNGAGGPTAVTVFCLGRKPDDPVIITVPANTSAQYPFPQPGRGVKRIIIKVHPPKGATVPVEVAQSASFVETCVGDTDLVFDVE